MQDKRETYPPPTPEEWARLPLSAKIQIVAIVFFATWQAQLAHAWLKVQGIDDQG